MSRKKALVLGATGQDGSYMVELLIDKKYEVHGVYRKSSVGNTQNIEHLIANKNFFLHKGDLLDPISLNNIINKITKSFRCNFKIILTGGYSEMLSRFITKKPYIDQNITIKGIMHIYKILIK